MVNVVNVFVVAAAVATIIGVYPALKVIAADLKALMKKARSSVPADDPASENGSQGPDSAIDE